MLADRILLQFPGWPSLQRKENTDFDLKQEDLGISISISDRVPSSQAGRLFLSVAGKKNLAVAGLYKGIEKSTTRKKKKEMKSCR